MNYIDGLAFRRSDLDATVGSKGTMRQETVRRVTAGRSFQGNATHRTAGRFIGEIKDLYSIGNYKKGASLRSRLIMKPMKRSFFERESTRVAPDLLGCLFQWRGRGGVIIETEAYRAVGDPACERFYNERRRQFAAVHPAGSLHLHCSYGVHLMLNLLTKCRDDIGFVLIRSLLPTHGLNAIRRIFPDSSDARLCRGPGRLTKALEFEMDDHGDDLVLHFKPRPLGFVPSVQQSTRIGLSKGTDLPWRYTLPKKEAILLAKR